MVPRWMKCTDLKVRVTNQPAADTMLSITNFPSLQIYKTSL